MQVTEAQRQQIVAHGTWWVANKGYTDYWEYRPVTFRTQAQFEARNAAHEISNFDCSSSADELMYMTGTINDPSGPAYNFNGYGNTQTQYEFLPHLSSTKAALAGDLIMFDPPPENLAHVCVVEVPDPVGGNPTIFNMGSQGEPDSMPFVYEARNHPGQAITALSIANLSKTAPPPPQPADPYHYQWYDNARIHLHTGINSEANVVKNYDKFRANPKQHAAQLKVINANLKFLIDRLTNNMNNTHDPKGLKYHREFRLTGLVKRHDNQVVAA